MASKAETLRRKKHVSAIKAGLPDLSPTITGRKARGGTRQRQIEQDNAKPNLEARARRMGRPAKDAANMRDQMLGEQPGMALAISLQATDAKRLWQHYVALSSAEERYHRSIGKSIHPKCAKIEMMQERFEVTAETPLDLRTEDERDRAAQVAWERWRLKRNCLRPSHQRAIDNATCGGVDLVIDGKVTRRGDAFVQAMLALDVVSS